MTSFESVCSKCGILIDNTKHAQEKCSDFSNIFLEQNRDKLNKMFQMQEAFMKRLQERDGFEKMPEWPLDLTQKSSQRLCKQLSFESINELIEAVQLLKNSKPHRLTEITDFDLDQFLEELVDSFKFFIEILIFAGVTPDMFFDAYCKKDKIINERINSGY